MTPRLQKTLIITASVGIGSLSIGMLLRFGAPNLRLDVIALGSGVLAMIGGTAAYAVIEDERPQSPPQGTVQPAEPRYRPDFTPLRLVGDTDDEVAVRIALNDAAQTGALSRATEFLTAYTGIRERRVSDPPEVPGMPGIRSEKPTIPEPEPEPEPEPAQEPLDPRFPPPEYYMDPTGEEPDLWGNPPPLPGQPKVRVYAPEPTSKPTTCDGLPI